LIAHTENVVLNVNNANFKHANCSPPHVQSQPPKSPQTGNHLIISYGTFWKDTVCIPIHTQLKKCNKKLRQQAISISGAARTANVWNLWHGRQAGRWCTVPTVHILNIFWYNCHAKQC